MDSRPSDFFPEENDKWYEPMMDALIKIAETESGLLMRQLLSRLHDFDVAFDAKKAVVLSLDADEEYLVNVMDRSAERRLLAMLAHHILRVLNVPVPIGTDQAETDGNVIALLSPAMVSRFALMFLHHCDVYSRNSQQTRCHFNHEPITRCFWESFDTVIGTSRNGKYLNDNARIWLYLRYGLYHCAADVVGESGRTVTCVSTFAKHAHHPTCASLFHFVWASLI
ncbi:hypothetical protein BC828DRAFT_427488, partial [Blastocladiella britannica]